MISLAAAAVGAVAVATPAQAANWLGDSITASLASNQIPGITDQFDSPAVVGGGVEFSGVMQDLFDQVWTIQVDIAESSFTVTFAGGANVQSIELLDISLSGFSGIGTLTSAYSCATPGPPCTAFGGGPNLAFSNDNSSVAMRFNIIRAGETYTFTAVPEPASWAMMIAGFGLVGGACRRQRVIAAFA